MTNNKPTRLERLRELQSKRTQGEWYHDDGQIGLIFDKPKLSINDGMLESVGWTSYPIQYGSENEGEFDSDVDGEFFCLSANLMSDLLDVVELAKRAETVLKAEYGHHIAEVYFGNLFDALSKLEDSDD